MQKTVLLLVCLVCMGFSQLSAQTVQNGAWQNDIKVGGLSGSVGKMVEKNGELFIGGYLFVNGERAMIAKKVENNWVSLDDNFVVGSFSYFSDMLFVGDTLFIYHSNGLASYYDGVWKNRNGKNEEDKSTRVNGYLYGMHYDGQRIHLFGDIQVLNTDIRYHTVYDFNNYSKIGSGFNNQVYTVTGSSSNLFFGGGFTASGDGVVTLRGAAKWDGVGFTEPFYVDYSGQIFHMIRVVPSDDNNLEAPVLYISGMQSLYQSGGVVVNSSLAKYENGVISGFESNGSIVNPNQSATYLAAIGDSLVLSNNYTVKFLSQENGLSDNILTGADFSETFARVYVSGKKVYIPAYNYMDFDKNISGPILVFNGETNTWSSLRGNYSTDGFLGDVYRIIEFNDELYAFGRFVYSDISKQIKGFARRTSAGWVAIANTDIEVSEIKKVVSDGSKIYVAGAFTNLITATDTIHYLAAFDGTNWSKPFGENPDRAVSDIEIVNDRMYVAGDFRKIGDTDAELLAYYRNNQIRTISHSTTLQQNDRINDIFVEPFDDGGFTNYRLFIAGFFQNFNGNENSDNLAYYNGETWNNIGTGMNGLTNSVLRFQDTLYVGHGYGSGFRTSNGVQNFFVGKWDGQDWKRAVEGLNGQVFNLTPSDSGMYITALAGNPFNALGHFNGQRITRIIPNDLGTYLIHDFILKQDELIVAMNATDKGSGIAIYKDQTTLAIENNEAEINGFLLGNNYPNPFNPNTVIPFTLAKPATISLHVYNVLGQRVASLINNQTMMAGEHSISFDASRLSSGTYFYQLQSGEFVFTKTMTLIK